jgi:hypothetical protein
VASVKIRHPSRLRTASDRWNRSSVPTKWATIADRSPYRYTKPFSATSRAPPFSARGFRLGILVLIKRRPVPDHHAFRSNPGPYHARIRHTFRRGIRTGVLNRFLVRSFGYSLQQLTMPIRIAVPTIQQTIKQIRRRHPLRQYMGVSLFREAAVEQQQNCQ